MSNQIERAEKFRSLHIPGDPIVLYKIWDAIRDEIGDALGGEGTDRWLTIVFTTDEEWAI